MLNSVVLALLLQFLFAAFVFSRPSLKPTQYRSRSSVFTLTVVVTLIGAWGLWSVYGDLSGGIFTVNFFRLSIVSLVAFMAIVLARFSIAYLAGERRQGVYFQSLFLTLSCVLLVLLSNHLAIFWIGWVAISLSFHRLLVFYPDRPRAVLAAHKKFILARVAEIALLVAFICLYSTHNTFNVQQIVAHYSAGANTVVGVEQLAAVLLAVAALIKCAQLPVHGWLIQVVESPTPVSALLHAGIINLGGFLIMLFGPLVLQVAVAKALLLIVAGLTAVLAALIMTTRISLKVRLAWSTSAQMGLMLVECALGLFELALLHLLAHSAYKAHAFLTSSQWIYEDLSRRLAMQTTPSLLSWIVALGLSAILVSSAVFVSDYQGPMSIWVLLAGAVLLWSVFKFSGCSVIVGVANTVFAAAIVGVYLLQKTLLSNFVTLPEFFIAPTWGLADSWVLVLILGLMVLSYFLYYRPDFAWTQKLSRLLYAGFYLDEWFTRATLIIWPVQLPVQQKIKTFKRQLITQKKEC
ncbi:NADH-quinone oxidoreductase subunit L [Pseudoalteromonas sp. T1lg65]|uniref:NADH-quinone oxidoreductase subunit L n=1 Tax=Pseudoalteromonas sp. T1lg65 TaxID=2077101 RepID=UPI003F7998C7